MEDRSDAWTRFREINRDKISFRYVKRIPRIFNYQIVPARAWRKKMIKCHVSKRNLVVKKVYDYELATDRGRGSQIIRPEL